MSKRKPAYQVNVQMMVVGGNPVEAARALRRAVDVANAQDAEVRMRVVSCAIGGRGGALMMVPVGQLPPGTIPPGVELEELGTGKPAISFGATIEVTGAEDAADAVIHTERVHEQMAKVFGADDAIIFQSAHANQAAPDMLAEMPNLMREAGRMMGRGYDRGIDGEKWKGDEEEDDEDGDGEDVPDPNDR